MTGYHLAQVNIAAMLAPLTDPVMRDFVDNLDGINALAEGTPGFVWRLKGDDGNATAMRVFDNDMLIINVSVWESLDALYTYVYKSDHAAVYRRRREWFEKMGTAYYALWWVPAGHRPTPDEAKGKLTFMDQHGVTPLAFHFKHRYTVDDMLTYQKEQGI